MKLVGVRVEMPSNTPIVLLQETVGDARMLPIFIGQAEATAIALALEDVDTPRPMTHDLIRDALNLVDSQVDFSDFESNGDGSIDAITFLHSGYGAEFGGTDAYNTTSANRMWSHRWSIHTGAYFRNGIRVYDYHISPAVWGTSGSAIGRIGVIVSIDRQHSLWSSVSNAVSHTFVLKAHETGHFLGQPDMYDTNGGGSGLGSWELMANSWGFGGSQWYPPHMSAFTRLAMNWDNATEITADGVYSVSAAEDASATHPRIYKITHNFPAGEYLLIENRQKLHFDANIPLAGCVIYHVDETKNHNDEGFPQQTGWPGSR